MDRKKPKIGVFVCHCGTNIAGFVDVKKVVGFASKQPGVVFATDYAYMCSDPGQALIRESVRKHHINRIVVAACSPRMHEQTFRRTMEEAGLNPFLLEIANIREQCSWVHMYEPEKAAEKAMALIGAAIAKVQLSEPLTPMEFTVEPSALIIGGGITGIQASLDLANKGFKVYLVEKEPSIGGHMAQLDKTFPTLDCSACILTPKMVDVSRHPNIVLLTYSEVESVEGFIGNFKVKVRKKARYVDEKACTDCGICAQKCPVKVPNEFNLGLGVRKAIYIPFPQAVPTIYTIDKDNCLYLTKGVCKVCEKFCPSNAVRLNQKDETLEFKVGVIIVATGYDLFNAAKLPQYGYGKYKNVITGLEFERLVNAAGPTSGEILKPSDGKPPKSIAFIQCVGSRDEQNGVPYCSRICCMASLKQAHQVKEKIPDAKVCIFYIDLRCFGKGYEEFMARVQREGIHLIRGKVAEVYKSPEDINLTVKFEDTLLGEPLEDKFDLVVLATALVPRIDTAIIQSLLRISRSADGFFLEAHPKLRPVETHIPGIYICGVAQGPKDIPDTVAQAGAAASQASIPLIAGKVKAEPLTAYVVEDYCGGCGVCEAICPYKAISLIKTENEGLRAEVNEALCQGCGSCGAACPTKAITMRGYTEPQLLAQLEALLSV